MTVYDFIASQLPTVNWLQIMVFQFMKSFMPRSSFEFGIICVRSNPLSIQIAEEFATKVFFFFCDIRAYFIVWSWFSWWAVTCVLCSFCENFSRHNLLANNNNLRIANERLLPLPLPLLQLNVTISRELLYLLHEHRNTSIPFDKCTDFIHHWHGIEAIHLLE